MPSYRKSTDEAKFVGGVVPWYRKAMFQVILVSFVCFCCPGMYNALGGLGGAGKKDSKTADTGNVAHYATFAVFAFFGGPICNKIGIRLALGLGSVTYAIYVAALYSTVIAETQSRESFVIFGGAIQGVGAGILWSAQGGTMLSYSTEKNKGTYIGIFWAIFNFGTVLGSAIPLGQNWSRKTATSVAPNTYIAFLVITLVGSCIPIFLTPPRDVVKADGTLVLIPPHPTWWSEMKGLFLTIKTDPILVLLFPFFWASNWFYTYQFNAFNGGGLFNIRTRALNNMCYWIAQIIASLVFGILLDSQHIKRKTRAWLGWAALFALVMAVWGGNFKVQQGFTRSSVAAANFVQLDVTSSRYAGLIWLYIFNGAVDAIWQTHAYYLIGSISNDNRKLTYLVGIYKGIQSAGAAVVYRLDAQKKPFMLELYATWILLGASLLVMIPVLYFRLQDHTVETVTDKAGDVVVVKDSEMISMDDKKEGTA